MKPNPGGQLAPDQIVGRDQLIAEFWDILEGRSIYMNDLRRVGKTMILRKMEAEPRKAWLASKRDLSGYHSAAEFATGVYRDSAAMLGKKKRAMRAMGNLLEKLGGTEIAGVIRLPDGSAAPWKEVLRRTFQDLESHLEELDHHAVFLWDEVPFLLQNIIVREDATVAMEVLDSLRALGQDYPRVRLLLTGSVGLHHVLGDLHRAGYANSPLNHMERVAPGPLDPQHSVPLATDLLKGAGIVCEDAAACAEAIAGQTGHVAFYIHRLISRLPRKGALTPAIIDHTLTSELVSTDNDWDFDHYRKRIPTYYKGDESAVVGILDILASAKSPLTFDQIRHLLAAAMPLDDKEHLRHLLDLLLRDHYLERDPDVRYRFRFPLIGRWWKLDRSL